ncbi:uncharacterized protein LOC126566012 [Anopheles maculipalpis]|uniref:uncharacterized protein LOC126566012 n=1 Tax=Anopheles maculipalpis TaxID=1496333 RepID=UPI0021599EE6|nr:uncharacterized protein LOC126566012 [Anopheles maculipalpis]
MKRSLSIAVAIVLLGCSTGSPLFDWGKKQDDGGGLLNKVSTIKQTVYEKKREFLNGVNEKVSKLLWIPPWPSSTTEQAPDSDSSLHHDPVPENPSIWWWQTTELPATSTHQSATEPSTTQAMIISSTHPPRASSTVRNPWHADRLVFTVADTNELELPNVSMYARSSFIPQELMLTDSIEYVGPVIGGGPPVAPDQRSNRLIVT